MTPKSTAHMVVCFLQLCIVKGQMICERQIIAEWREEPKPVVMEWTLRKNICTDFYTECWNMNKNTTMEDKNLSVPQICPVQLQLGDSLFISSEPSFQSYGMNLVNVSKEEFMNCPKTGFQVQQIFVCQIRGLHQVDPTWLGVGVHYFAELHKRGPHLCDMGLRLNIRCVVNYESFIENAILSILTVYAVKDDSYSEEALDYEDDNPWY
ncbi:hypothetical protein ASZ78_013575 [Callipepla squamata]|uniref:Uncharacterized protein n=1 Tax=Callipepla squamata TaxID=9009 RepID=A0A226N1I3_CALSU|nr:hypothetical protein ASZ78_013575 [Callipepla squamata]